MFGLSVDFGCQPAITIYKSSRHIICTKSMCCHRFQCIEINPLTAESIATNVQIIYTQFDYTEFINVLLLYTLWQAHSLREWNLGKEY